MGTHPIFESDFDCLTEPFRMAEVNKKLLKEIGKLYKGMPKENWSAYHRVNYLFDQNRVSENRYCRQPEAATHDAQTLLTYLETTRQHQELIDVYHGRGERSVKQAAETVGLQLPKQYQPDPDYVPSIWKKDD